MGRKFTIAFFILLTLAVLVLTGLYVASVDIAVLNPKGLIAMKERKLMIDAAALMLIVVIPVFIMTALFTWKYRSSNKKSTYAPDWDYSLLAESIWWGAPCVIVIILAIMTWTSTHELDPYKPLESEKKPLTIQVVALQWKWLFIYPEHNIATVNFLQFPKETPLNFQITSDAPMNSFWIPQLGGQMYAMSGMKSHLHLIAHETGEFRGSSANISGEGFARMVFTAKATTQAEFDEWVHSMQNSPTTLDLQEYKKLAVPSVEYPANAYVMKQNNLFDWILMKYMIPMPKED